MFDKLKRKFHHRNWPEVMAEVSSCKVHSSHFRGYYSGYYAVNFTYAVDGRSYGGGLVSGVEVQKGDTFPLRYDPKNPAHNSSDPLPNWTHLYDVVFCGVVCALLVLAWLKR